MNWRLEIGRKSRDRLQKTWKRWRFFGKPPCMNWGAKRISSSR